MFLINSRLGRLSATPKSSASESLHFQGHPLSRSYGVNMPSSLTMVLPSALEYSSHPPVSVCGTDAHSSPTKLFLEAWNQRLRQQNGLVSSLGLNGARIFLSTSLRSFTCTTNGTLALPSPPLPWVLIDYEQYRNINLLSIDYAFRPRLRFRLTLGGFTWPRKPWVFGE